MAATIALKEQTKNRMNFETGYLFCHVETKSFKLWLEALFLCLGFYCPAKSREMITAPVSVRKKGHMKVYNKLSGEFPYACVSLWP